MTDQLSFDAPAAQEAAEQGMSAALRAQRVEDWKGSAWIWLLMRRAGDEFTADDLVSSIGLPDQGVARNNVVGAWIGSMSRKKHIVWTGQLRKSERVIGHGNMQRVWRKV